MYLLQILYVFFILDNITHIYRISGVTQIADGFPFEAIQMN